MSNLARSLLIAVGVWAVLPLAWTAWFIIRYQGIGLETLKSLLLFRVVLIALVIGAVVGGIAYIVMRP
jgi:hypothetical protein